MPVLHCCNQSPGLNGGYSNQVYPVPHCVLQNSSHWIATAGSQLAFNQEELHNCILIQAALEMYNQAMNYYYLYYLH